MKDSEVARRYSITDAPRIIILPSEVQLDVGRSGLEAEASFVIDTMLAHLRQGDVAEEEVAGLIPKISLVSSVGDLELITGQSKSDWVVAFCERGELPLTWSCTYSRVWYYSHVHVLLVKSSKISWGLN
jgi:hypothetical protein